MENYIIRHRSKDQSAKFYYGIVVLIGGIVTLDFYVGYLFLIGFVILMTYKSGFEFNIDDKLYRNFYSFAGLTKGKWKSYSNYPSVSIKKKRRGMKQFAPRTNESRVDYTTYYEVILKKNDNRNYKILFATKNIEQAKNIAGECCEKLNLPYSQFGK